MSNYKQDMAWLKSKKPDATEEQQEAFAEKVAVILCDYQDGIPIKAAYLLAAELIGIEL